MKNLINLIIFLFLLQSASIQAQIVGGRENGQQAPSAAKAAELSAGGVSGDVNLFNGTYGTSYDLGTVSTPGGLSYTATMSYSSSFASGDNLPHTSGIPYGEGWSLGVPTISISTEDYNQYTLSELNEKMLYTGTPDWYEEITFDNLEKEGRLMWFAPTLNIPGVASGRMVYKYTDKSKGRERAVFVLHKFERYIEARFDGQYWEVILDDGTIYEFLFKKAQQRNANNRRTNWTGLGTNENDILNQIIPKIEETTWYVNKMSHPNKHGKIHFSYNTFGKFDMYKEFKQNAFAEAIKDALNKNARINLMKNVYRDIFLREITTETEKLQLKHRSLFDHNLPGVYEVDDGNITRLDSLYTSKVIKSWGGSGEAFNSTDDWKRYKHLKSDTAGDLLACHFSTATYTTRCTYGISPTNPYQGQGTSSFPGNYVIPHLIREDADGAGTLNFNHGFLESPHFGTGLPAGDMYEIRSNIAGGLANFDINIVTGDNGVQDRYLQYPFPGGETTFSSTPVSISGKVLPHAHTWQAQRNEAIYSTFNQAVKWNPLATLHGNSVQTSNFFTMPNLPNALKGMRIQIGPANSDVDYSLDEEEISFHTDLPTAFGTAYAYFYNKYSPGRAGTFGLNPLLHGHNVPANFGIGMPWHMVSNLYGECDSRLDFLRGSDYRHFWWNNGGGSTTDTSDPSNQYYNTPTLTGSSKLTTVELVHHAKNPYMLHEVRHLKLNGASSTSVIGLGNGWELIGRLQFEYDDIQVKSYANYLVPTVSNWVGAASPDDVGYRNIILLKSIKQMPIDESATYIDSEIPTTHFEYIEPNIFGSFVVDLPDYPNTNINLALLNKIIDPLGKETSLTYGSSPKIITNFSYNRRPKSCYSLYCDNLNPDIYIAGFDSDYYQPTGQSIALKRGNPYAFTINAIVENKTITDADGTREWDYTYETMRTFGEYPPMQDNISWDKNHRTKYGYSKTTVEGPYLTTGRPYTEYYHYNFREHADIGLGKPLNFTENEGILWSKLYKVKQYDENDKLISQTETEYDFHKAFIRGSQRVTHDQYTTSQGGHAEGHDYIDMIVSDYLAPDPVTIYNTAPPSPPANITDAHAQEFRDYCFYQTPPIPNRVNTSLIRSWINYYRNTLIPYYESGIAGGYQFDYSQRPTFIKRWTCSLSPFDEEYYATTADYDTAVVLYERYEQYFSQVGQIFREHFYFDNSDYKPDIPDIENEINAIISYEREYEDLINQWHPYYLDSYFIKTTQKTETAYDNTTSGGTDSIQTITEYEYYDADETGATDSEGYDIMLYGNTDWQQLQWEPSWQLYKTRTYSPQHPDAFSQKEYFYYYDLINREDMPIEMAYGLSKHLQNLDDGNDGLFYPVQWTWKYRMRNIAFEERTTSKAPAKNAVSTSSYFTYSNDWNNVNIFSEELDSIITVNACDTLSTPIDSCSANIPSNCHRPRDIYGVPCNEPLVGFYYMIDDCNKCWWCLDDTVEPQEGEEKREINLGFPHKDNLFYASTSVKTKHEIEADYNSTYGIADGKYAILRFVPDDANINNFLPEFPYDTLKTHEVLERNMYGAVQLEANEKDLKTRYEYSAVKRQNYNILCYNEEDAAIQVYVMNLVNVPTSITVGVGLPDSLTTHYRYHPDYSIDSIIDPNGKVLSYDYDMYGRLENTYLNGDKTGEIAYSQWNNNQGKTFKNRMLDNYVQTTTFNDAAGNESIIARAYVDPLGRSAITATHKSATPTELVMAGGMDYDNWDRQTKLYKPYTHSGGFAGLSYGMHTNASTAHAENQYENTPRSRVLKSAKYGIAITDPDHTVDNTYALMTGAEVSNELGLSGGEVAAMFPATANLYRLMRTQVTDEDGKIAKEYTNAFGQKVATLRNDGTANIVTLFYYDSQGQLIKVTNPKKQHSTYTYNLLGQLYQKTTVDNGTTRYIYNKSGQITYEQDAKGDTENYMRAYRYDEFGRNVRQDKYTIHSGGTTDVFYSFNTTQSMHWLNSQTLNTDTLYANFATLEKHFYYGNEFDKTDPTISDNAQRRLANLSNEKGQLTYSISYNDMGNPIEYRFMSYNDEGYLEWETSQFEAEGITATKHGKTNFIEMPDYNLQGSLKVQNIDLDSDGVLDFQYYYEYDEFNRLEEVYAGYSDNTQNGHKVASYTYDDALGLVDEVRYYASGDDIGLKNTEIDVITHSYDIRDRLTQLDAALFRWQMFYDADNAANAQSSTTSWNGNINSTVADYKFADVTNISDLGDFATPTTYAYTYDNLNRLTVADAHGVKVGQAILGDVTYSYDKIGNLETLNRKIWDAPSNSLQTQDYLYAYQANTNRLLRVEAGGNRYTYDANGNMVSDTKKNLNNTIYGRANLPQTLEVDTSNIHYQYNASDMRIYKKVDSLGTILKEEYYLRDATGRELAVIDDNDNITWYIYGKERVASTQQTSKLKLDIKVWLEGAYNAGAMNTRLNQRGLLPGQTPISQLAIPTPAGQPFNIAPWYYDGDESVEQYSTSVVDWVLLSLRTDFDRTSEVFRTTALLHSNGQVTLTSNLAPPDTAESLYIVIEHRNHSGIISAQKVALTDNTLSHDFTLTNSHSQTGAGQKQLAPGVWAMFAGNALTDAGAAGDDISGGDKSGWFEDNGKFDRYISTDFNLDSDVNGSDKSLWFDNNGTFSALQVSHPNMSANVELVVPQFIYYLYDHLGNTRVTYSVEVKAADDIDYTVESATDYYPYGKALRSYGKERYQSTYHERDLESGFDYRGARFYDSDVARFNSLDPLAAEFPEWSDYNYVLGNPNSYTDPDGRTPILGAIIGAAIDYGVQVTVNVVKDGLSTEAFTSDVNWTSVGVSAVAGATGVGIAGQIRKLGTVGKVAAQVTTDAVISTTSQAIVDGEVNIKNVATDVAFGQVARKTVGGKVKEKAMGSKTGKALQNELNKQKNIARGKSRVQGVKKTNENVSNVEDKLGNFQAGKAALGSGVAAGSLRKATKVLTKEDKEKN